MILAIMIPTTAQNIKIVNSLPKPGTVISKGTRGATPKNALKSFELTAPDTVVQGETFEVTYTLRASQWDNGKAPMGKNIMLQNVTYDTEWGQTYSTLTTRAEYTTSQTGDVELPAMTMPVGGKEVTSTTKHIFVKPNPEYGKEMTAAHKWLASHGAKTDSLCLSHELGNNALKVFCDTRLNYFCIVAKEDVWDKINQPVLAYSTESPLKRLDSHTYQTLLGLYETQIDSIKEEKTPSSTNRLAEEGMVAPLFGNLRWGQNAPYNSQSPTIGGNRIVLGCVPLSMALIMKYYGWPDQGNSDVYLSFESSQLLNYKFSNFNPKWTEYKDEYDQRETGSAKELAMTLGVLSLCTNPDIRTSSVSISLNSIKHLFVNNLKYSGRMAIEGLQESTAKDVMELLRRELHGQRPCILSRGNHAFICDGFDGDFFHYNMGWHGYANGYYQLAIGKGEDKESWLDAIVYGIEPFRQEVTKEVTLTQANTLQSMLTEEEQKNITSLSITGPLGSSDIRLLRKMAGGTDYNQLQEYPWGALRKLDLSKAKIMKDKEPYLITKATGKWWRTQTTGELTSAMDIHTYTQIKSFDFDNMDEKTWKSFKAYIGSKQDGIFYTRTEDNKYWANYNCQANTIGILMFSNCSSLNEIILPENTKRIDHGAFTGCQSIEVLKIPVKTKELGETPFDYCTSLRELYLPQGIEFKGKINDHCSPGFKAHAYN